MGAMKQERGARRNPLIIFIVILIFISSSAEELRKKMRTRKDSSARLRQLPQEALLKEPVEVNLK